VLQKVMQKTGELQAQQQARPEPAPQAWAADPPLAGQNQKYHAYQMT
jgi:hypothetical protein